MRKLIGYMTAADTVLSDMLLAVLWIALFPLGAFIMIKRSSRRWKKIAFILTGLPLSLIKLSFWAVIVFAAFLPEVDLTMANRKDKTVFNSDGNYSSTFLENRYSTHGKYDLVKVELEPHGGNGLHYHTSFDETFTCLEGVVTIMRSGKEIRLKPGQTATACKGDIHEFRNDTNKEALLLVRVSPSAGLEKSIRVAYGLANDGKWQGDLPKNLWHLFLLCVYSETYIPDIPYIIQKPLFSSLAKIAQWKGEDRELYKYFR